MMRGAYNFKLSLKFSFDFKTSYFLSKVSVFYGNFQKD